MVNQLQLQRGSSLKPYARYQRHGCGQRVGCNSGPRRKVKHPNQLRVRPQVTELEQKRLVDGTEDAERCLWHGWALGLQQARGSAPRL